MTLLIKDTPKEKLEAMIKTHGYKKIDIIAGLDSRDKDLHLVISINDIPEIIMNYIMENYNITLCSSNRIEFYEHKPIGVETSNNEGMI